MNIEGSDLILVNEALSLALGEINNQIGSCPDPKEYANELLDLADTRK